METNNKIMPFVLSAQSLENASNVCLVKEETEPPKEKKKKRDDIQGLRGIAILSVLLTHLDRPLFANGYLGVDIFFALSGYLMAAILSKYETLDWRSILNFYSRRIKRIIPMYCALLLFASIAAPIVFIPVDIDAYKTSLSYALPISSYMLPARGPPHLSISHLWSLSIEMQYYLIIPFAVIFARYLPNNNLKLAFYFVLFTGSLALCDSVRVNEDQQIFRIFQRAFQFLIGSIVYQLPKSSRFPNNLYTKIGCAFVALALIALNAAPLYMIPMVLARILVTVCTGILLHAGNTVQTYVLTNRPLTYIGDLSYVMYLFHFPILSYFFYFTDGHLTYDQNIKAFFIFLAVSIPVHHILENYFIAASNKKAFSFWAASYVILITFLFSPLLNMASFTLHPVGNPSLREAINFNVREMYSKPPFPEGFEADRSMEKKFGHLDTVQAGELPRNGSLSIAVIGDAYACRSFGAIAEAFPDNSGNFHLLCDQEYSLLGKNSSSRGRVEEFLKASSPHITFVATRELSILDKNVSTVDPKLESFINNVESIRNASEVVVLLSPLSAGYVYATIDRSFIRDEWELRGPTYLVSLPLYQDQDEADLSKYAITTERFNQSMALYRHYLKSVESPTVLTLDLDSAMCEGGLCRMYDPTTLHALYAEGDNPPTSAAYEKLKPVFRNLASRLMKMAADA